jgi:hypothetical protein
MSESVVAQLDALLQRLDVLRALERDNEIARLRARVEGLEKHLGLMIANNLAGSFESLGLATDRAIAVLPDWLEKANGYTRAELDAAAEIVNLRVEEAKP